METKLRPYQQESHDAAWAHIRSSLEPCVIEAATGAGKSHIIAALANTIYTTTGKHVLCTAPSKELVMQNREKYLATGNPASVFSASAGRKCLKHPVVFGTPKSIDNSKGKFGDEFGLIIIDEAHGITPTIKNICSKLIDQNPKCRIIGTTATPYRTFEGYIYKIDEKNNPVEQCKEPFFTKKVFSITAPELIDMGYLTPHLVGDINVNAYNVDNLLPNIRNSSKEIDKAFLGHGRKTSAIVADVIDQSRNRKGVMLFASTVQHAKEIRASLPSGISAMIASGTRDRDKIIKKFKRQEIKYIVSVGTLTTGFDATHVDVIALLRFTDSVGLLQQILGRGSRLYEGKKDCLVLDYAGCIEKHCPDGDLYNPEVKVYGGTKGEGTVEAICKGCGATNMFAARPNPDQLPTDAEGYFVDLAGERIETESGPLPGHYGRRCKALLKVPGGLMVQCNHRWTSKKCLVCGEDNDIAAKYCCKCKAEIIDPNEKLIIDFKRYKRDPTNIQTDKILSCNFINTHTRKGDECIRAEFKTEYRSVTIWYMPKSNHNLHKYNYRKLLEATNNLQEDPKTITYKKDSNTKFYKVIGFNEKEDSCDS